MCRNIIFTITLLLMFAKYQIFAIQMPTKSSAHPNNGADDVSDEENTFTHCVRTRQTNSVMACAGVAALNKLQHLQAEETFRVTDGVTFTQTDSQHTRGINMNFLDQDPSDYRGIFNSIGTALSQRTMLWDMSSIYPGLGLRLGPSYGPGGTGYLEFVLDPIRESIENVKESTSTARVLTRQLLIPFLMGFKFNIATIVPILFGLLALLAKKAVFLSKLAFIASSAIGLGSLVFGNNNDGSNDISSTNNDGGTTFYSNRYQSHNFAPFSHHQYPHYLKGDIEFLKSSPPDPTSAHLYTETLYRGASPSDPTNNENSDPVTLTGNLEDLYTNNNKMRDEKHKKKLGRNFSWNEAEVKTN